MKILEVEQKYQFFQDLDGVLVDFEGGVEKITGKSMATLPKKDMWRAIHNEIRRRQKEGRPSWWAELGWQRGGEELWSFIRGFNPTILTGIMVGEDSCIEGKIQWCQKHLGIPADRVLCVRRQDKVKYSGPNRILIDDHVENCSDWSKAGGIAILHKNVRDTLNQLKEILGQ